MSRAEQPVPRSAAVLVPHHSSQTLKEDELLSNLAVRHCECSVGAASRAVFSNYSLRALHVVPAAAHGWGIYESISEAGQAGWANIAEAGALNTPSELLLKAGELLRERLQQQLGAVFGYSQAFQGVAEELMALRKAVDALTTKIDEVAASGQGTFTHPIRSFAPEPFEVAMPIDVVITPEEDEFQASALDVNLHAYGETREEALYNLKSTILETYHRLRELPDDRLGRSMLQQKQVLSYHLREADTG